LEIELWLPIEKTDLEDADVEVKGATASAFHYDNTNNAKLNKPALERSLSGKRAHTTLNCSYLPPIYILACLPTNYPSECQPNYKMCCNWLSKIQMNQLCKKLDDVWKGMMNYVNF
jgi:hypothetical protein